MAELGWTTLVVTQEHLQNLASQAYMTAAELATYHVHQDPTCMAFYERGFDVPSHRFLRSLLQFYGMELHHLSPLGILHRAAFMTLCEAYMRIEPHFDLWNYFFRARL
jgi:hypothetical protein